MMIRKKPCENEYAKETYNRFTAENDAQAIRTEVRFDSRIGTLEYTLFRNMKDGRKSFSISVRQIFRNGEISRAAAFDVTSELEEALRIFGMISSGLVSPMTLDDVIYDLLP